MRSFVARLRARRVRVAAGLVVAALAVAITATALAVHDEAFELDGNIDKASPAGGPEVDWNDDIVGVDANGFSTPKTSLPPGFSAATAGPDFTTTTRGGVEVAETGDDSTFTTNSKDILNISAQWRCVHANNVTDKGDLVNTYGVAYTNAAGEVILYFGAEKNDASGTNDIGVWFLQDPTVNCTDTQGGNGTAFNGSHVKGDTLVVSEFTNGGSNANITAYKWDPTDPAAVNNLVQLGTSGRCDQIDGSNPPLDDRLCAITNRLGPLNPPWKTWDKDGKTLDTMDTQQFYEGAINVSAFGLSPCVNTLLTNTRSSKETTATLYDFARRQFSVCDANIKITPDDVNEVGQSHTFTVTVNKTFGGTESPVAGVKPTVTLTDANGAVNTISENTCASTGTNAQGKCTVTFTSQTAGTVTGHAAADVPLSASASKHVETDGQGSNSGDAVKRFVDSKISIGPDDVNKVGDPHTFTVTVLQDDGLTAAQGGDGVTGFGPAVDSAGRPVKPDVTLTDSGGAVNAISSNTCPDPGADSHGECAVTFTSNTAGTVVGHAAVTFEVSGVSISRETDTTHGSSGDATKVFVAGTLAWIKHDNAGLLQGGATFEVCRTHDFNSQTGQFDDIADVCVSVPDDTDGVAGPGLDQDPDAGEFLLTGLVLGRYTVRETLAPGGFVPDPFIGSADLTIESPDATIEHTFVNNRPIVKLTEFGYTNTPTGNPTSGVVSGTTVYTVKIKNFGLATSILTGSLAVSTDASSGTLACTPTNPLPLDDAALEINEEVSFSLTCIYTDLNDGAKVTADLIATYETNGLIRMVSGSPASITFTVQKD
jgi:hypothetical protein